jgi:hypothetical protein
MCILIFQAASSFSFFGAMPCQEMLQRDSLIYVMLEAFLGAWAGFCVNVLWCSIIFMKCAS